MFSCFQIIQLIQVICVRSSHGLLFEISIEQRKKQKYHDDQYNAGGSVVFAHSKWTHNNNAVL